MAAATAIIAEPTRAIMDAWGTLEDIFTWAGVLGDLDYANSIAGSLLVGLDGPTGPKMQIEDFASCDLADVGEFNSTDWEYSVR